jgi:hypothetical protein
MEVLSISDILKDRIKSFNENPEKSLRTKSVEYSKKWNEGVKCFQTEINKEREVPISFIAVRQKLVALKEVDDLRWFYYHCKKYGKTKDKQGKQNSFGKCFFGALRVGDK